VITGDQLVERLRSADKAWSTVHGTTRQWRRQDLVNTAFARHFARLGRQTSWSMQAERGDNGDDDPIIEAVLAVAFDAQGRRRRAQAVSRRQEDWLPDLVVFDGPTFWARSGDTVQTNSGGPLRGHGGTDIVKLLLPGRVPDGYDLTALDEQDEVAGRTCAVVNAVPHPPDPYGHTPGSEVFDMIAGGTLFRLSVDVNTGVLLRVIKVVDGVDAEICEFLDVVFDEPLDDELFAPLS
jgi:hypothetical protein